MKESLLFVILLFMLGCSSDDSSRADAETGVVDFKIEKFIFETDSNKIRTYITWGNTNGTYPYRYFVYSGHGATDFSNPISNGNGKSTVSLHQPSTDYTIKVQFDVNGTVNTEEFRYTTPSIQEFDDLLLQIDTNYIGYTAINYNISGLNPDFPNEIFYQFIRFFYTEPITHKF
ncbi:hypothetical protein [Croceitalea dokdonensis]|uniref:hypothetical protein n=1 Tax=Croceitalea dokdonensis TaxID=346188 RepID=UPI0006CA2363|nr:hypothetical protein [Croceitalea dokdonensis]